MASHALTLALAAGGLLAHPPTPPPPPLPPFDFTRFPHFSWRARVVSADPHPVPAHTTMQLFDRHHARPLGGGTATAANSSEWSEHVTFDNSTVALALATYPNTLLLDSPGTKGYDQRAGQPDFPALVVWMQISSIGQGCVNRTRVAVEVTLHGGGDPQTLEATLAGCVEPGTKSHHLCADCGYLGLMVGRNSSSGEPLVATFRQWNAWRYWPAIDDLPPLDTPPQLFPLMDNFAADDDIDTLREGAAALARLGFRGVVMSNPNLTRPMTLEYMGNQLTTGPSRFLPARNSWGKAPINLSAWTEQAQAAIPGYLENGFQIGDVTLAYMSMEPNAGAMVPLPPVGANPALAKRWQAYLQTESKLSPSDFGASTWAQVQPSGRPAPACDRGEAASPSCASGSLTARRRYYWTTRFIAWDAAMAHAAASSAMQAAWTPAGSDGSAAPNGTGADLFTYTNFNNWPGRYLMPGPEDNTTEVLFDWHEFGRLKGSSLVWTEDWFGDGSAFQWSYLASVMRLASEGPGRDTHRPRRTGETSFGGDIVPRAASGWPPDSGTTRQMSSGLFRKIMTFVGSGAKGIKYFQFGPEYLFPGNCYSDRSYWPDIARSLQHAHRLIGTAEPLLWPAQRVLSQIAIVAPRSSFPWDVATSDGEFQKWENLTQHHSDYEAEAYGIYLALAVHSNLAVDVIDEDSLTSSGLQHYRLVVVTQPNLPVEGMRSLLQWTEAGGSLLTTTGAAQYDRYNSRTALLDQASGVTESERPRLNLGTNFTTGSTWPVSATGTVQSSGTAFSAAGVHSSLTVGGGKTTQKLATFSDGSAAAVSTRLAGGKGRLVRIAFAIGLTYTENASNWERLPRRDEFSPALRGLLASVAEDAKASSAGVVVGSAGAAADFVETSLMLGPKGAVVFASNWDPERQFNSSSALLQIDVPAASLPFEPTRVASAEHGNLTFQRSANGIKFFIPLDMADFILISRE